MVIKKRDIFISISMGELIIILIFLVVVSIIFSVNKYKPFEGFFIINNIGKQENFYDKSSKNEEGKFRFQ